MSNEDVNMNQEMTVLKVTLRPDGTRVLPMNQTVLARQLLARREAARESKEQADKQTAEEMDAMMMLHEPDGTLRRANPNDEADRLRLFNENGLDVFRTADVDEYPIGVQMAFRAADYTGEQFRDFFTPAQYRMPPDSAMLCHRFDASEPMGHSVALHAGALNYVMPLPVMAGLGMGKGRNDMQTLSHRVIAFYYSWIFDMATGRPALTPDEQDDIVDEVTERTDAMLKALKEAKTPAERAAVDTRVEWPVPVVQPWLLPVQLGEVQPTDRLYVKYARTEGGAVWEEIEKLSPTTMHGDLVNLHQAQGFLALLREPRREDMEEAVAQIHRWTRIITHNHTEENAQQKRREYTSNVCRTLFCWFVRDGRVPEEMMQFYREAQSQRNAGLEEADALLNRLSFNLPAINFDHLPQYVKEAFDGADERFLRVLLRTVDPPPPSDWTVPKEQSLNPEDMEMAEMPEAVAEWKDAAFRRMDVPAALVPFLKEHAVDYYRLPAGIRAYYLLMPQTTEVIPEMQRFVAASETTGTRPPSEWFMKWWQTLYNRACPAELPGWCNDVILDNIHTMSVMGRYFAMRARVEAFIENEARDFPEVLAKTQGNIPLYLRAMGHIGGNLVSHTKDIISIMETTLVALNGISIPPEHMDKFCKGEGPIGAFREVEDAVADWRARGGDAADPTVYLNGKIMKELEMTSTETSNFMHAAIEKQEPYQALWAMERAIRDQHPNMPDNPKTCPGRMRIGMTLLYLLHVQQSEAAYNHCIKEMAKAVLPALPSTHRKAHHEHMIRRLIEAKTHQEIEVEFQDIPELNYVAESLEGVQSIAKRPREETEEQEEGGAEDDSKPVRRSKRIAKCVRRRK